MTTVYVKPMVWEGVTRYFVGFEPSDGHKLGSYWLVTKSLQDAYILAQAEAERCHGDVIVCPTHRISSMKCATRLRMVHRIQDDLIAVKCSIPNAVNRLVALGFSRGEAADMVKEWMSIICYIEDLQIKHGD
jgi:hypothetical protein